MIELLRLCGFSDNDLDNELPRVKKAFDRLGITADDIERGKRRLNQYYDIDLEGVRGALRLCLREMVNSMLAREEGKQNIIFGFNAPGFDAVATALVSSSNSVYAAHHSWTFQLITGCIFDKMVPILEAAEKKWLKTGLVGHCGNVKTIVGLVDLGLIPVPDLMVTTGYLCETAPKTLDLFHELYGFNVFCGDTCQDRGLKNYDVATGRSVHMAAQNLRQLVQEVQGIVGFEIADDMLREVLEAKKELGNAFRKLRRITENSDPMPMRAANETILMSLRMLTLNLNDLPEIIAVINTLCRELEDRVDRGIGAVEKGSPRVIATMPMNHSDPRLEHLIGETGIALIANDPRFIASGMQEAADPYEAISESFQTSIYTILSRRISSLIEGCKLLNVDGVLGRYHRGCRTYAGDAVMIKQAIEGELDIPVLLMDWENFDPRAYNHEEYRKQLEVFKAMMTRSRL